MSRKRAPHKCFASEAVFLSPEDCASVLGYRAYQGYRYGKWIEVKLTDCTKEIHWSFDCSSKVNKRDALAKVERAIEMLEKVRALIHNLPIKGDPR